MLNEMRSGAGNFVAKLLLGLLILSFAVWGIGDSLRHTGHNIDVAKVGDASISATAFASGMQREKERVQKSLAANYTPELFASLHVESRVLNQLINRALLNQEATALGLRPSDADIAQRIAKMPSFVDEKGRFHKEAFLEALRRNNMSEAAFIEQLRQEISISLLMQSMASLPAVPEVAIRTLQAALSEERAATIYTLSPASLSIGEPSDEDLVNYHKEHAGQFSIPEYRSVSYVTISDKDVKSAVKISEDDLRKAYTEHTDEFKHPERRRVEQLLYSIESDANKAAKLLADGKTLEDVAKSTDAVNKNALSLGEVEQEKIIAEAADQVFALKEGGHTVPIKSAFGWHIFQVSKIIPSSVAPFEEVRANLQKDAENTAGDDALNRLSNQLVDALASGLSMADAAKELHLKAESFGPVNIAGETQDGKKAKPPELDKFMEVAFKTADKSESSMITSKGGIYYLLHIDNVIPERVRPLAEVKAAVTEGWKKQESRRKAAEIAENAAKKLADPKTRDAAIAEYKLKTSSVAAIKHDTESDTLPASLVTDLFTRKLAESTGAHATKNGEYAIAVVKSISPAPLSQKEDAAMSKLRESITGGMTDELTQEYLNYLKSQHPVTINESAVRQISEYDNK